MNNKEKKCNYTSIGGQALIEGVMMVGPKKTAMSVRLPSGDIDTEFIKRRSVKDGKKYLNIPIVRGCINFVETMVFGSKCLYKSAEKAGIDLEEENENPSKFEQWLEKVLGDKLLGVFISIGMVLGVALSIGLFVYLPMLIVSLADGVFNSLWGIELGVWKTIIEGIVKMGIFVLYLFAVSKMKDIRRVFEYHGAEHKTIACYEAGEELTPANAKKHTRFHPRCGTSFLFIVLIISILVSSVVTWDDLIVRFALKIAVLPIIVGVSYEFIKLAGKYNNIFTRVISAPGMWMQRLTTNEPDESQLEIAIASMLAVIPENENNPLYTNITTSDLASESTDNEKPETKPNEATEEKTCDETENQQTTAEN